MTTLRQGDLPQDATIFRTIALHNKALFVPLARSLPSMGVYGIVSKAGTIQRGDPVHAEKTPVLQSSAFWLSVAGNFLKRQLH
jgi:hypothetical protein